MTRSGYSNGPSNKTHSMPTKRPTTEVAAIVFRLLTQERKFGTIDSTIYCWKTPILIF